MKQSSYLIYFWYNFFNRAKWNKYIWNKIEKTTFADFRAFIDEGNLSEKVAIVEEGLHGKED